MSDLVGELARVRGAFATPTLKLLYQRHAPVVIAIFRTSFSREIRSIPAARLHDQVEAYLDEMRLQGLRDVPTGSGRDLCLRWMRGQWLVRSADEDGIEAYSLTSHAQDALALVTRLTRDRSSLSEHRISTIVSQVRRFNTEVNPDRSIRVAILDAEIDRVTRERQHLLDGGDLPQASADYLLEGYGELLQLVSGLPGDFARVEEAFTGLRTSILEQFRAEELSAGPVVDSYLARIDALTTATAEGRAFDGAFTLLRDEALLLQLREDITALLEHPLAEEILIEADRAELRGTVSLIRAGIESVLVQRNRVTATLRDYIVTHDVARDRELDAVLRAVGSELALWMRSAGPRSSVPLALLPHRVNVSHLRERFHDVAAEDSPPPLSDVSGSAPDAVSLAELLAQGGPSLGALGAAMDGAMTGPERVDSLGELFSSFDDGLRRPVEILGLLHLAASRDDVAVRDGVETYAAVRHDGSRRDLSVPVVGPAVVDADVVVTCGGGSR